MSARILPKEGRKSPRFGHLGMWNISLGPNSPVPGERLMVVILDQDGKIVRRFEQVRGRCTDEGYVDFCLSHNCRPAVHEYPIVDIDENGKVAHMVCQHYSQEMGMDLYLTLLTEWVNRWGKPEYAL